MAPLFKPGRPTKYDPEKENEKEPPAKPGLYRIRNTETNEIVYVGKANNLKRRCKEHKSSGKL